MTLVSWIMLAFLIVFLSGVKWSCENADKFPGGRELTLHEKYQENIDTSASDNIIADGMARWHDGQMWSDSAGLPQQEVSDNTPLSQMR